MEAVYRNYLTANYNNSVFLFAPKNDPLTGRIFKDGILFHDQFASAILEK